MSLSARKVKVFQAKGCCHYSEAAVTQDLIALQFVSVIVV